MRRVLHGQELRPEDWGGKLLAEGHGETLVRLLSPEGTLLGLAEPAKTSGFLHPAVVFPRRSRRHRARRSFHAAGPVR